MPTHDAYPSHGTSYKALQSHLRLNLETEESSNMAPKQHHSPPIEVDAQSTVPTDKNGGAPRASSDPLCKVQPC